MVCPSGGQEAFTAFVLASVGQDKPSDCQQQADKTRQDKAGRTGVADMGPPATLGIPWHLMVSLVQYFNGFLGRQH